MFPWGKVFGGSAVKNLPVMPKMQPEPQVQSLGWDDPREKEMATPLQCSARRILWTEKPGG